MNNVDSKDLRLQFDIHTIEHLGVQMYKTLPPVLAELISNSYDADANNVEIIFKDSLDYKEIVVNDDGIGMSYDELNDSFLKIGRNRRKNQSEITPKGRYVTGRKGLGKLAIFGIATEMEIRTIKNNLETIFIMNLEDILNSNNEYYPKVIVKNMPKLGNNGTCIILRQIKRKSKFDLLEIKEALAKRFNFVDENFIIKLIKDNEIQSISSKTKWDYITPQFEWNFPEDDISENSFCKTHNITGKIITTEKPLNESQKGIFLYARGKLVNPNDFFGIKTTSSFAYNYFTGFINVDFVDSFDKDMVTTNRDGLTWENEEINDLKLWLQAQIRHIEKEWRNQRENVKADKIEKNPDINLKKWYDTMPKELHIKTDTLVQKIISFDKIDNDEASEIIGNIKEIIPEYPYYHWRSLHPEIQSSSDFYYKNGKYYDALAHAIKKYKNNVKDKSGVTTSSEYDIMMQSFGKEDNKPLKVCKKYNIRPNGSSFSGKTIEDIEDSQKYLSAGIISGARNVISHEEIEDLQNTGLLTEKNCLDMLSLLSYLQERLDDC